MAYPQQITDEFGTDLFKVLGPASERVTWSKLSKKVRKTKTSQINKYLAYINTSSLGAHPNFVEMLALCFRTLVNLGDENPLQGIDLPVLGSLKNACKINNMPALNYASNTLIDVRTLHKNASKQRDVFFAHILIDIVFRFNPALVFPGVGRKDSTGRIFVNDAQHRTLACMMLGIDFVPLNYIESDDEYWDVMHYAAINIVSLACSDFDKYRIRIQTGQESKKAGYPVDVEDQVCMDLNQIFLKSNITVIEKKDTGSGNARVLSGIGNMIKYYKEYDSDIAARAIELNAIMFPKGRFATANSWGLMEFMKYQDPTIDPMQMDHFIRLAIKKRYPDNVKGASLHLDIKEIARKPTGKSDHAEPVLIAHGIYQMCCKYSPSIAWVEPTSSAGPITFKLPLI